MHVDLGSVRNGGDVVKVSLALVEGRGWEEFTKPVGGTEEGPRRHSVVGVELVADNGVMPQRLTSPSKEVEERGRARGTC